MELLASSLLLANERITTPWWCKYTTPKKNTHVGSKKTCNQVDCRNVLEPEVLRSSWRSSRPCRHRCGLARSTPWRASDRCPDLHRPKILKELSVLNLKQDGNCNYGRPSLNPSWVIWCKLIIFKPWSWQITLLCNCFMTHKLHRHVTR